MLAASLVLSACGATKDKPSSQVTAKIKKEEISVHQISFVVQRAPGVTGETADVASRQILERLISKGLAVQEAQQLELDRRPSIVQALEAARHDVLARSYLDSVGDAVAKPNAEKVAAFYAQKPALFKYGKSYTFQEVTILGAQTQMAQAQAAMTAARSMQESSDDLKGSGLKFSATLTARPAENLLLELLDKIAALYPGQTLFLPRPGGAKSLIVATANPEPADAAIAAPAIEKFLLGDRKRLKTETKMRALRAAAKVERISKFDDADGPAANPAPVLASEAQPNGHVTSGVFSQRSFCRHSKQGHVGPEVIPLIVSKQA